MTINPLDVVRVTMTYSTPQANIAQNVRHYQNLAGFAITDADATEDFRLLAGSIANTWAPRSTPAVVMESVKISVFQGTSWFPVGEAVVGIGGTGSGDVCPHGVAALANMPVQSSVGQSRIYLPGFRENDVNEGIISTQGLTTLLDIVALLVVLWDVTQNPGVVGGWQPGVWERVGQTFKALQGVGFAESIAAYQRRRKQGVGL